MFKALQTYAVAGVLGLILLSMQPMPANAGGGGSGGGGMGGDSGQSSGDGKAKIIDRLRREAIIAEYQYAVTLEIEHDILSALVAMTYITKIGLTALTPAPVATDAIAAMISAVEISNAIDLVSDLANVGLALSEAGFY